MWIVSCSIPFDWAPGLEQHPTHEPGEGHPKHYFQRGFDWDKKKRKIVGFLGANLAASSGPKINKRSSSSFRILTKKSKSKRFCIKNSFSLTKKKKIAFLVQYFGNVTDLVI